METAPRYRTQLGRVRGLGSAKEGVQHWWVQRLTAVALVPLGVWFVTSLVFMTGADYPTFLAWFRSPVTLGLMILLVVATFYHSQLGVRVVLEDYVNPKTLRVVALVLNDFLHIGLGLAAILALSIIAFGG